MSPDHAELLLLAAAGIALVLLGLLVWASFFRGRREQASLVAILEERLAARETSLQGLQQEVSDLDKQLKDEQARVLDLREQLARLQTEQQQERLRYSEKLEDLQSMREQLKLEFSQLATASLEKNSRSFTESSSQQLKGLLQPLNERIQQFQKRVEDSYNAEARERFSLQKEIRSLQELNTRISEEAVNLTRALKGETKTQGTWGEVILERVLERSGLVKGREYDTQVSLRTEEGKLFQPDVVVHLPDDKDVIIDAKVSLVAYERYCAEEDEGVRSQLLKEHIRSIRQHLAGLSAKDYQTLEGVNTLDGVMMFLPVEAAFTLAAQEDSELFADAFDRNILLAGPSTLLAMLRTIQSIWRYEHQNRNALDIASRAGRLYDKFVLFTQNLDEIGQRIQQSQQSWDKARRQLSEGSGNLVSQVEKLRTLGARATKQLSRQLLDNDSDEEALSDADQGDEVKDD